MDWITRLTQFFLSCTGASMATIVTMTIPYCNKGKGDSSFTNVFGNRKILKLATRFIGIGHRYATAVNNRVTKEIGDHEEVDPQPRTWGERIGKSVLFTHVKKGETNPETYLEYFYLSANSSKSTYTYVWDNGMPLTESEVALAKTQFNLDPPKKISTTQSDAGLTEENAVIVNQVMLKNIVEVRAYGQTLTRDI